MEQVESVVIGAGACGLMCAVQAGFLGKQVLVLEKNDKAGAKILISMQVLPIFFLLTNISANQPWLNGQ
jgi:predicted flavoprotein YhiN